MPPVSRSDSRKRSANSCGVRSLEERLVANHHGLYSAFRGNRSGEIPATIQVETFVDRSPSEDKTKRIGGTSATELDSLTADLSTEVTNAVTADFLANGVFAEVGKNIKNSDAVMTGQIKRFYGRAGLNSVGWITLPINPIWFLGVPMQSTEGEVDRSRFAVPMAPCSASTAVVHSSPTGTRCTITRSSASGQPLTRPSIRRCSRYESGFSQTRASFERLFVVPPGCATADMALEVKAGGEDSEIGIRRIRLR